MADLILSAFADEYSDSLSEQLAAMQAFGIGHIELRHADGKNVSEMTYDDITRVKALCSEHGVGVSAIGSPLGKISIEGDIPTHLELTRRICETANHLDAKYVRMFSFYLPEGDEPSKWRGKVVDTLGSMIEIAECAGITLCHENEAQIYGETPERCFDLLQTFSGRLRAVFDMGNFVLDGHDPIRAYELLFSYIAYFHIKDALYAGAIVPAGKGEAEIGHILADFKARGGHSAYVSLEPHLETFAGLNALVGKAFTNPYKYDNSQAAFEDAVVNLKKVMESI